MFRPSANKLKKVDRTPPPPEVDRLQVQGISRSHSKSTRCHNVGNKMQILYLSAAGVLTKCPQSPMIGKLIGWDGKNPQNNCLF
jgi:hypothetical protein